MGEWTRTITITEQVDSSALAVMFCEMDGEEQAAFFYEIGKIARTWPGAGWCQQSSAIAEFLTPLGKETIAKLAEWAADPEGLNA